MERISLTNLQEQFDTLKSTSLPQLKRYFRRRIAKCLNECKLQAISMSKIGEHSNNSKTHSNDQNEYDFGWGSDFEDYDDEEDDDEEIVQVSQASDNKSSPDHPNWLSSLALSDAKRSGESSSKGNLTHSRSLQSIYPTSISKWTSNPSVPPVPKHFPPSLIEDNFAGVKGSQAEANLYEVISPENSTENDYLLPNTRIVDQQETNQSSTYEYIRYFESSTEIAKDSISNILINEREVSMERPLPPIPNKQNEILVGYAWFKDVERERAEKILRKSNLDGSYLVRKSRRAGIYNPYTLTIFHDQRIFHLNIRIRVDDSYALGKEKTNEKCFSSVDQLIEHHKCEPIFLTSKGLPAGKVCLLYSPTD